MKAEITIKGNDPNEELKAMLELAFDAGYDCSLGHNNGETNTPYSFEEWLNETFRPNLTMTSIEAIDNVIIGISYTLDMLPEYVQGSRRPLRCGQLNDEELG